MRAPALLSQSFFARDPREVASELLGARLRRGAVVLRITEVEAYGGPEDSASHCRFGRTARNEPMWGPPGHAYVYLCYGLHAMLNVVTGPVGEGAAVLVRACEPLEGRRTIRARRGEREGPVLLAGPGKVGAALELDRSWSGHPLFRRGGLELHAREVAPEVLVGPRVGVGYARLEDREAPWRFAAAGTAWITERRSLRPSAE